MPWEELLKKHDRRENDLPVVSEDRRNTGSLIQQAAMSIGQAVPAAGTEEPGEREPVRCGDGYFRRSPVQEYKTAADYKKRKIRRIIGGFLLLILVVLLALALVRAGLLTMK